MRVLLNLAVHVSHMTRRGFLSEQASRPEQEEEHQHGEPSGLSHQSGNTRSLRRRNVPVLAPTLYSILNTFDPAVNDENRV